MARREERNSEAQRVKLGWRSWEGMFRSLPDRGFRGTL